MKNSKKMLVALCAVLMALSFVLTGCGQKKTVGLYTYLYEHNHTDMEDPISYSYKLELFKDGTYVMNYHTKWALPVVTLVYGRDLTSYGKYTKTAENAEEGTVTYKLELPTRLQLIAEERSSVTAVVDTENWPAGNPAEEVAPGFVYTLNARAETEVWEKAEDFIKAYGRSYEVVCDIVSGTMKVTVDGEQIPGDAAVKPAE